VTYESALGSLPDGCFVQIAERPYLFRGGGLLLWTPEGYERPEIEPADPTVTVLTPAPICSLPAPRIPAESTLALDCLLCLNESGDAVTGVTAFPIQFYRINPKLQHYWKCLSLVSHRQRSSSRFSAALPFRRPALSRNQWNYRFFSVTSSGTASETDGEPEKLVPAFWGHLKPTKGATDPGTLILNVGNLPPST
jgi:hypothetical protein